MTLHIIDDAGTVLTDCTLEEFVEANEDVLDEEDLAKLARGHLVKVGGGAQPLFFIEAVS